MTVGVNGFGWVKLRICTCKRDDQSVTGFYHPIKVNPGPGFESWNLDPSFWTTAGFGIEASSSEAGPVSLEDVAGTEEEAEVEEGKGDPCPCARGCLQ